jgi:hypothetical protein
MASQRQIQANRRNAQRSSGPKAPEGKSKSSRNHSIHGFRSRDPVQPGEDPAEFAATLAALRAEFQPAGPRAEMLVRRLAAAQWRLERAMQLDTAFFTAALSGDATAFRKWGPDPFDKILRCQESASRAFFRTLRALRSLEYEYERSNPIPQMGRDTASPTPAVSSDVKIPSARLLEATAPCVQSQFLKQ